MKLKMNTILTDIQTDRQTELSNCNFVKTVLMLIVVIYHCILYWNGTWFVGEPVFSAPVCSILAQWMNTFHIYSFTLVSGYLFFYMKCEQGRYNKFLPFVMNKFKRLLIPYIFVSLIWVIPFALYFFQYNILDVIVKFVLGTAPNQLWFLLMLFGVFLIFYPLTFFFKNHNHFGAVLAIVFWVVGIIGQSLVPNVFQIFRAFMYIPLFLLGFKIRQYGSRCLRKIPIMIWILSDILLFVAVQYLSKMDGIVFKLLKFGFGFALNIIGALMAFVVLQTIAEHIRWKDSKIFDILNKNSMSVYLFHQQIVYVFIYSLNGILRPYIHAGVNFIGAMMISLVISAFLRKFKCTRVLIGEK